MRPTDTFPHARPESHPPVKGYIDRIERTPDGEYVVVDFKTG